MKKNVLVINTGSTSVKYKFFNFKGEEKFCENFKNKILRDKKKEKAFLSMIKKVSGKDGLKVAFRVVHGGDISGPVILDNQIKKKIKGFISFAPIHNKLVLKKISLLKKSFEKSWNDKSFFVVFDTDFHQTISQEFSTYPMDQKIAQKYKLKKYGFHGIAIESVLKKVEERFIKEEIGKNGDFPQKVIVAHLGGGCSITAIKDGKSQINSMGVTPISGLMMATRIGDVDSDLDKILGQKMGKSLNFISDMFLRKSGFLGLTGSEDIKSIFEKAKIEKSKKTGEFKKEELAFNIFLNQIVQKIGAYYTILKGVDMLVFSGGIGEGNSFLRKEVLKKIEFLGITKENSIAIKTDEEKTIFNKIKDL